MKSWIPKWPKCKILFFQKTKNKFRTLPLEAIFSLPHRYWMRCIVEWYTKMWQKFHFWKIWIWRAMTLQSWQGHDFVHFLRVKIMFNDPKTLVFSPKEVSFRHYVCKKVHSLKSTSFWKQKIVGLTPFWKKSIFWTAITLWKRRLVSRGFELLIVYTSYHQMTYQTHFLKKWT